MLSIFTNSISRKLTVIVAMTVLCAVLISSLAAAWRETSRHFELRRGQLEGIASAVAATISEPLANADQRAVMNAIKGLRDVEGVTFARVFDRSNRSVAAFGAGIILESGSRRPELIRGDDPFALLNLKTYPVVKPIIRAGRDIGKLEILADLSDLREALWYNLAASGVIGLFAALIAVALAQGLQPMVVAPIQSVTSAMRDIRTSGAYGQRVSTSSTDETAALVTSFNAMLDEIQDRDHALRRHRDRLEADVEERTRDLAQAKSEADAANAAKSDFLATMSHEIRTPMNGMMVMAELLASAQLSPKHRRYCDVLVNSGKSLLTIINDILDISKIEAGQLELEWIATDPTQTVDDAVTLFAERAAANGLELACYVDPAVPSEMLCDPVRLNQVLGNLINNALKFTETGGVLVRLMRTTGGCGGDVLRFEVEDTGIGIAQDKLPGVFDAFTQAEQSTTRRFGGTGIGLTICKRLVTAMGGEIGVDSVLGKGTTFWFEVPARAEPVQHVAPSVSAGSVEAATIAIDIVDGPVRSALVNLANAYGLTVLNDKVTEPTIQIIRCDGASAAGVTGAGAAFAAPQPIMLGIVPFGATASDGTGSHVGFDGEFEEPIGTRQTRQLLRAAAESRSAVADLMTARASHTIDVEERFDNVHVLAADDSDVNLEVLREALSRLGATLTTVTDGAEAVAAIETRHGAFDLVFMDGSMPNMDGYEATRLIRQFEQAGGLQPIPVIALTAHVVGRAQDEWMSVGASDYVAKPFTLQAIRQCLGRWCRNGASAGNATDQDQQREASPREAAGQEPLVDVETIAAIREIQGDDALLVRVIGLYLKNAPVQLEKLMAIPEGDHAQRASAAHALKSLSRSIGAARVGAHCDEIEAAARDGQLADADTTAALVDAVPATCREFETMSRELAVADNVKDAQPTVAA